MVRLTTISNILSGLGIAVLGFSAILWYLLLGLGAATPYPYYTWIAGAGLFIVVLVMSTITTFTEITGFVHPEDKLISNMFVFLYAIAAILIIGIQYPPSIAGDDTIQRFLFDIGSMIVIAYVFLFVFVFFSAAIMEAGEVGQVKEMTSRFMLVSLFIGGIMAGIKLGLDWVWVTTNSYNIAAGTLGVFAIVLVLLIVFFLGRRYEPVGGE
ncbi:MAG: hypothetical protein JSW61_04195 [Candidatus Thorarchaeota archaeon]|nr:MAG: hypothetical protein JSW61_04195 [Candidatus Thorarchaeota archaeon]